MALILNFTLLPEPPSDADFAEACPEGGTKPDCEIRVISDFKGADPPDDTYGDLAVVNLPLESETAECGAGINVWMKSGCPPDTPEVICDVDQNPTEIAPDSSETIYILDGMPPYHWEIVGGHEYTLEWATTGDVGGRPDGRLNSYNTLYSSADSCGTAQVKITDNCLTEIICTFDSTVSSQLNWDWISSSETIVMGMSGVTIAVMDGKGPYTWSVTGQGFTLGSGGTSTRFNTISASWCACGTATITVVDACGAEATGSVRCTDKGYWKELSGTREELRQYVTAKATSCSGADEMDVTKGGYRVWEQTGWCQQYDYCCLPDCSNSTNPVDGDPYSYLVMGNASDPIDCMTYRALPGCGGLVGMTKFGDCCKSGGSLIISRIVVAQRRAWAWVCPDDFEVEWDYGVSEETIDRNESGVVIAVTGGTSPYTWTCLTSNFTVTHGETTGLTNTLSANAVACGACLIKVEDACGIECFGEVRCTYGSWVEIFPGNTVCKVCTQGVCDGPYHIEGTQGVYKIREHVQIACRNNDHTCPPENCSGADVLTFDPTVLGGSCLVSGCFDTPLTCACWAQNLGGSGCGDGYHATGNACCGLSSSLDNQVRFGVSSRQTWRWECT